MPIGIHRRGYQIIYAGIAPPPAPANLAITGASAGIVADLTPTVTFTAAPGATSHKLQWSTDSGFSTVTGETTIAMPTAEYTHAALLNFTDYYWRVAAIGPGGQGPWSDTVTVQTWVPVFYDLFPTDYAAPIPDPLNSKWDVYDTGNKAAVASGLLGWGSSTANWDPFLQGSGNLKALLTFPGGVLAFRMRSGGGRCQFGWRSNLNAATGGSNRLSPQYDMNAGSIFAGGRANIGPAYAIDNTFYWLALAFSDTGAHLWVKGGAYTDWTLIFTVPDQTTLNSATTLAPYIGSVGTVADFDSDAVLVGQFETAPLNTATGWATAYQASSTANDTIAMEANGFVAWTLTAATGVTQELSVRRTDDNNRLVIRCNQSTSTLKLIKIEGGSETELQSVAQTWTNGTAYRVNAWCNGNTIAVQAASGSEWSTVGLGISQSNSFNNTATGVKVSHNGGVLASWPIVSAAASAQLNALIAGAA